MQPASWRRREGASSFRPYASIGTNLLFFEKGAPTEEVWYWEHQVPEGQKAYLMTKPIRLEHLDDCVNWWGGASRKGRVENERAWKVTAEEIKARGYNLDIKNPHTVAEDHGDPEELLEALNNAEAEVVASRDQLKAILSEALLRCVACSATREECYLATPVSGGTHWNQIANVPGREAHHDPDRQNRHRSSRLPRQAGDSWNPRTGFDRARQPGRRHDS